MNPSFSQAARHTLDGTMWVTLSEGLALPTGFLIIVFLTRKLGPAGYGLYTLAAVLVIWIESSIGALFTRTTIKLAPFGRTLENDLTAETQRTPREKENQDPDS